MFVSLMFGWKQWWFDEKFFSLEISESIKIINRKGKPILLCAPVNACGTGESAAGAESCYRDQSQRNQVKNVESCSQGHSKHQEA